MSTENKEIRVRIAPSPTGLLHIGTARAALFNYLFAKRYGPSTSSGQAQFVLRIEDTDLERSDKKYEQDIIDGLRWLGIDWDEGPSCAPRGGATEDKPLTKLPAPSYQPTAKYVGNYGPYRQTERLESYKKYLQILLDKNLVYYCPCSEEALEKERQEQIVQKRPLKHLCPHRDGTAKEGIIRFRTPTGQQVKFNDLIRGEVEFGSDLIGDFSLAKALDVPLYNFAVVIDDYEMKISHVIRGEDHISNTPKQLLIQQALGLPTPQYGHLPLILGTDKSKLSKRHGAVSVNDYREQGYLAEVMVNFIAFLGWNPGTEEEIFSLGDLEKRFSVDRVGKSGAIFNVGRLNWLNGYYIRHLNIKDLVLRCQPYLQKAYGNEKIDQFGQDKIQEIIALEQERMVVLSEISEKTKYFFIDELVYNRELLRWKNMTDDELKEIFQRLQTVIGEVDENDFSADKLKEILAIEAEKIGDKGKLLWPLRVALTGLKASPDPFSVATVLGKEKTLRRLVFAQKML